MGKMSYQACFTAGTLIHSEEGLIPIEKVRVGMRVLSKPEHSTEAGDDDQEYRKVINTVATLDQRVHAVQVKVEGEGRLTTLFPTHNHPFWVEGVIVDGEHWLATECLAPGMVLQLADGRKGTVHANGLVRRTQHEDIGFAGDDQSDIGIVLDLSGGHLVIANDALAAHLQQSGQALKLGDPYLTTVYNFEVEETHTYYVGETAVWVHNANCYEDVTNVLKAIAKKKIEPIENACFDGETWVHARVNEETYPLMKDTYSRSEIGVPLVFEIWHLRPGVEVLSRCEKTGEVAYKRITKVFEHELQETLRLHYYDKQMNSYSSLVVTPNHPFWVIGKGWVNAIDLKAGDQFETCDGRGGVEFIELEKRRCPLSVYNIEVEDFHTYFVDDRSNGRGILVHNKNKAVSVEPVFVQELIPGKETAVPEK